MMNFRYFFVLSSNFINTQERFGAKTWVTNAHSYAP